MSPAVCAGWGEGTDCVLNVHCRIVLNFHLVCICIRRSTFSAIPLEVDLVVHLLTSITFQKLLYFLSGSYDALEKKEISGRLSDH